MRIVYLDQNKWIALAQAVKSPSAHPAARRVLEAVVPAIEAGELLLPLTATNLYETQKVNRLERRYDLAVTQVTLSRAWVFRGMHRRLEHEVATVLAAFFNRPTPLAEDRWFLSQVFFESISEADDPRLDGPSAALARAVRDDPQEWMMRYLMETPDEVRTEAIRRFDEGCDALRARIEDRRDKHRGQSASMRRKIYRALTAMEQQDVFMGVAERMGLFKVDLGANNGAGLRAVLRQTPTFDIETEIVLRLEAQPRPIYNNDMRDLRSFSTVLAYSDLVIAENQFTNLARQAGLDRKYGVRLETDLEALLEVI